MIMINYDNFKQKVKKHFNIYQKGLYEFISIHHFHHKRYYLNKIHSI